MLLLHRGTSEVIHTWHFHGDFTLEAMRSSTVKLLLQQLLLQTHGG